jgi:RimJ/RimL family protein N-acetyltransferase
MGSSIRSQVQMDAVLDRLLIEPSYGIAPGWRRKGLARRACRLVADWVVEGCDDVVVELRIARMNIYSQRVAIGAGFGLDGAIEQLVTATGKVYDDLRFVYPYGHPQANGEGNTNR